MIIGWDRATDTYVVTYGRMRGLNFDTIAVSDDVYAHELARTVATLAGIRL